MNQGIWSWIALCRKVEQWLLWVCICLVPVIVGLSLAGVGITVGDMLNTWAVLVLVTLGINTLRKCLVSRASRD